MNNSQLSTKKKLLIGIPTVIIIFAFLTFCWHFLTENVFLLVLVSFFIAAIIFEYFTKIYEKKKREGKKKGIES